VVKASGLCTIYPNKKDAKEAFEIVEDLVLGECENRHGGSVDKFWDKWFDKFNEFKNLNLSIFDYELLLRDEPRLELIDKTINISNLKTSRVGGIINLMVFTGAETITISTDTAD